jgi:hypothetical protein
MRPQVLVSASRASHFTTHNALHDLYCPATDLYCPTPYWLQEDPSSGKARWYHLSTVTIKGTAYWSMETMTARMRKGFDNKWVNLLNVLVKLASQWQWPRHELVRNRFSCRPLLSQVAWQRG